MVRGQKLKCKKTYLQCNDVEMMIIDGGVATHQKEHTNENDCDGEEDHQGY